MEQFGIWVLLEVVVIYLSLLDFTGIGGAFVKYIAEYHARKDFEKCSQVVNLGWAYYTVFWIIMALLVFLLRNPILRLFDFPSDLSSTISIVFLGILLISLIRGSFAVFRSVLLGVQRMDITNIIAILASLVNAAGVILFLSLGFGLKGLVMSGLIVAVFTVILQTIFAYKALPQLRFRPFSFSKDIFKKTFVYGINIRVASLSELINTHVDKIFLGYFLNTMLVGSYELGAKVARIARSFPEQLLPAILPASSELHALDDKDNLQKLYHRGSKYLSLLTFPLAFFIIANASLIIIFWMGNRGFPGFTESVLALQVLSVGYVFTLLVSMGRLIARGMGIPQYEMRSSVLIVILNIALSIILIIKLGFTGTLLGTTLSGIIGSTYFFCAFNRRIGEPVFPLIRKIFIGPFFFCLVSLGISMLADYFFVQLLPAPVANRTNAFIQLLVKGLIFLGVYLLCLFKSGYIDKYDKEIFSGFLEMIKVGFKRKK
ncbi:MAG: polysaccharide biosynthesis protein [Candidatus Aminicenantes bacterium]|nr:polysaccharide biosynthesis protein [Candidatus Aminicenantes bacterium]